MINDIYFVFTLLIIVTGLFIWDKFRMDLVALFAALSLALSGVITPAQAVSGFGAPVVVMIAALFIIGEGLYRTGIASAVGHWLLNVGGGSEKRLLLLLIPIVAILSAFMSSTGAVALFIPIILSMCHKSGFAPSKLLMPVAFASLIGGMLTLIGTPPNMIVSAALESAALEPFHFFDFTPVGFSVLLVGTCYLVFVGYRLLPNRKAESSAPVHLYLDDFAKRYGVSEHLHSFVVPSDSMLVGQTVFEAGFRTKYEVTVIAIERKGKLTSSLVPVLAETKISRKDKLIVYGEPKNLEVLCRELNIVSKGFPAKQVRNLRQEFGVAEVMLREKSSILGKTISEGKFREKFGLSVIGMRRNNQIQEASFGGTPLKFADSLLVVGGWRYIEKLALNRDFIMLETPAEMEEVPAHGDKVIPAVAIITLMLITMVTGLLPALTAILVAAFAMVVCGCVTMPEAYKSLNASSLILIACMLPMALAMEQSGAASMIVSYLVDALGSCGPMALAAGFFLFTSIFSQFISNTATTVLVAPIALSTALTLGYNPQPILMMVAIAASTAFATPVASPVNTLILGSGNYRFADFAKVGIPLQLLVMVLALLVTPIFFPFN